MNTLLGPPGTGRKRPWWLVARGPRQLIAPVLLAVMYALLGLLDVGRGRFHGQDFVWVGLALLQFISAAASFVAFRRHPEWVGHPTQEVFQALRPLSRRTSRRYAFGVGLGLLGCVAGLALTLPGPTRVTGVVVFLVGVVTVIGFTAAIGRRPAVLTNSAHTVRRD